MTWRLKGSLPAGVMADLWTKDGAKFVLGDRLLDAAASGPKWLAQPGVAEIVVDVLLAGNGLEYELGAWVLMPNHVHLLIRPSHELSVTVNRIKGRTARMVNDYLGRTGLRFWAKEYYDHWIRDRNEEQRIVRYIENNPVKAGLCASPEEWPWSSAKRA